MQQQAKSFSERGRKGISGDQSRGEGLDDDTKGSEERTRRKINYETSGKLRSLTSGQPDQLGAVCRWKPPQTAIPLSQFEYYAMKGVAVAAGGEQLAAWLRKRTKILPTEGEIDDDVPPWKLMAFRGNEACPSFEVFNGGSSGQTSSSGGGGGQAPKLSTSMSLTTQSAFLLGRERGLVDVPLDHPSCSSQHAVIYYGVVNRVVEQQQSRGKRGREEEVGVGHLKPEGDNEQQMMERTIQLFIIDLGSTNKTSINGNPIPPFEPQELVKNDVLQFGQSSRQYVLLQGKVV